MPASTPDRFMEAVTPFVEKWSYRRDTERRYEELVLLKAVRLAPTLEICEALLRGEHVPTSKLDPDWVKHYNL
jgi:hypothetical protein